jgi:hypothetical protein
MNEEFKMAWNTTGRKFTPSGLEWQRGVVNPCCMMVGCV